jgi:hypothetical protein
LSSPLEILSSTCSSLLEWHFNCIFYLT